MDPDFDKFVVEERPKRGWETATEDKDQVYHKGYIDGEMYLVPDSRLETMKNMVNFKMRRRKDSKFTKDSKATLARSKEKLEEYQNKLERLFAKWDELENTNVTNSSRVTPTSFQKIPDPFQSELDESEDIDAIKRPVTKDDKPESGRKAMTSFNGITRKDKLPNDSTVSPTNSRDELDPYQSKFDESEDMDTIKVPITIGDNPGSRLETMVSFKNTGRKDKLTKESGGSTISSQDKLYSCQSELDESDTMDDIKGIFKKDARPESKLKTIMSIKKTRRNDNLTKESRVSPTSSRDKLDLYQSELDESEGEDAKPDRRLTFLKNLTRFKFKRRKGSKLTRDMDAIKSSTSENYRKRTPQSIRFIVSGHIRKDKKPIFIVQRYEGPSPLGEKKLGSLWSKSEKEIDIFIAGRFFNKNILEEENDSPKILHMESHKIVINNDSRLYENSFSDILCLGGEKDIIFEGSFIKHSDLKHYTPVISIVLKDRSSSRFNPPTERASLERASNFSKASTYAYRAQPFEYTILRGEFPINSVTCKTDQNEES